ncbi:MAG: InlB B-repeat-containing protein [Desulfobacterales bacterium]|nr:InlB B-repeat-containing protein [Desulfobacterales bacterium]
MGEAPIECLGCSLPAEQAEIQQFKTDGHVLGFGSDRVYMVGLGYALIEEFVGASGVRPVAGNSKKPQPLRDSDAKDMGAPAFQGVTYPELWEGITLRYDRAAGGLAESVYVVQPGADAGNIRIRYNADFEIEKDGGLRFQHPTQKGYFRLTRPIAWQEVEGRRVPVEVAFKDHGDRTLGFTLRNWNSDYALIIDPVYQWHTFYGSASNDEGYGIAVTADAVYITGISAATWNGEEGQTPKHPHSGGFTDIVIVKLNLAGAYQWHTFYGAASSSHNGRGIAATGDAVYVTGMSQATWNGDDEQAPKHPHSGEYFDIVVLKLNSAGAYQWHTFYGASDHGYDIKVSGDAVYVAGYSGLTWNGDGATAPKHAHSGGYYDIVVLKLTSDGAYQWHTFYGSDDRDYGYGIAITGDAVYVTGSSTQSWDGDGSTVPKHAHSGSSDIIVLKLTSDGVYQWHTFYGSASGDNGNSIAVTGDAVYVTGLSVATWDGDGSTVPKHAHSGGSDIMVLKLTSDGVYQWHTFYGSANDDYGYGIAVTEDTVYMTGFSKAAWDGDGPTGPIHGYTGSYDIAVLKLDTAGAYQSHTFYGSADSDWGHSIAATGDGVFVAGKSGSTWNGDEDEEPIHSHSGSYDIAVMKLSNLPYYMAKNNGNWSTFGTVWFTSATGGTNPADYTTPAAAPPNAANSSGIIVNADVIVDEPVTIDQTTVNVDNTLTVSDAVTLIVNDGAETDLDVNGTLTIAGGGSVDCQGSFDATGGAIAFTGPGELYLSGDVVSLGALTAGEGTVGFAGATAQIITGANTFYNLVIDKDNPTDTVNATGSTLVVANALSVTQGVFTSASTFKDVVISAPGTLNLSGDITVSGDWMVSLSGTFNHNNHTVVLNGADQYLSGTTTFYNLTKEIDTAATLEFESESTTTITNALTLNGADGQLLFLRSDGPGTQWDIDAQGGRDIAYVDVQDSNNTNGTVINAQGTNSVDSGNNLNWLFDPTVAYDGNGNTGGAPPVDPNNPYAPGAIVTVLGNTGDLVKTGYTFIDWNTLAGGGGSVYNPGDTFAMPTTDVTLYAQWALNTYAVTYNGNGATSGTAPADQIKTHGVDLTLAENTGNLARTGYTFAGWNTQADGLGTDYAEGALYTVNEAVTLYAKWISNHTITVSAAPTDGGTVTGSGTYVDGSTVTVNASAESGYVFVHWTEGNTVVSCSQQYMFTVTGNRTLQANFSQMQNSYDITGSARPSNYGTVTGSGSYNHGAAVTMTALPNQGFVMTNWIETWPGLAGYCVVSTDEQYSFSATRNRNLTADFRPKALPGVLMLLLLDDE